MFIFRGAHKVLWTSNMCSRNPLVTLGVGLRILTSLAQPSLHLSRKIILAKAKFWCSKMQPLSGNQRPHFPNIFAEDVSCTAPATWHPSLQILFKRPTPAIVFATSTKPSCFDDFWQGAASIAPASTMRRPKVVRTCGPLPFLLGHVLRTTMECTFSTSELNFQKCSEHVVLLAFWLLNVLRAIVVCNVWPLISQVGSAPAALASLLFGPLEPQNIDSSDSFSSLIFFFSLLWLFAFPSVHMVRILTSKTSFAYAPWNPCKSVIEEHSREFIRSLYPDPRETAKSSTAPQREQSDTRLASLFRGKRNALERWDGNIAKPIGTRLSGLHSTSHFWWKSRRAAWFWMLETSISGGSLTDDLNFSTPSAFCRKSRKIAAFFFWFVLVKKSRRISSFSTCQLPFWKEVSYYASFPNNKEKIEIETGGGGEREREIPRDRHTDR